MIQAGKLFLNTIKKILSINIEAGKSLKEAKKNSLIFFPYQPSVVSCGISALLAFKKNEKTKRPDLKKLNETVMSLEDKELSFSVKDDFLGGDELLDQIFEESQNLKQENIFADLFFNKEKQRLLIETATRIEKIISNRKGKKTLSSSDRDIVSLRLEKLMDISWCLKKEILENIRAIENIIPQNLGKRKNLGIFKKINAVLNSIDRLEVRGRDSAGISIIFTFTREEFQKFRKDVKRTGLSKNFKQRTNHPVLSNNSITIDSDKKNSIAFAYKFAAEIGSLGKNVSFIRTQIKNDLILHLLAKYNFLSSSVSAHTRWASVGSITEANCHPVDNAPTDKIDRKGIIHVCLNGDIDNYLELKTEYEARYDKIHEDINTDTKIIPLQIEHYLKQGAEIEEAFRLSLNDFQGSHAISMHTDLAPGKLFLAQKGSGQAIFVGIGHNHYIAASELYGIVEETQKYIRLDGRNTGQIIILDQNSSGRPSSIKSFYYDSTPIKIEEDDILKTKITSRDIDRQNFPHYFLKELFESPDSVRKTFESKISLDSKTSLFKTRFDEKAIPGFLEDDLKAGKIKKIYFIGQGTAGVAAQGCADILNYYLGPPGERDFRARALKSSELSGHWIIEGGQKKNSMADNLVVAVSQSGTTADTNRTVDMAKECGAKILAIVNRRDSDLTFKTDGIIYTGSGRDIEMSVASTKAFYSQITAGAILSLHIAGLMKKRSPDFIAREINEIIKLPEKMKSILDMKDQIKSSASRLAVSNNHWATVGSGPNKTSADEIRIKLSELCYKTISSDFIEDKKHIDLSSEPLIIICATGTRKSVLSDIVKDTAIFHAHKATTVIITDKEEDRFDPYSENIFKIPDIKEHFAPVLNTLVGHIWGYYAALAINRGSKFMYSWKTEIQDLMDEFSDRNLYEILAEKKFREKITLFYNEFSRQIRENGFPGAMKIYNVSNIILLLKYMSGKLSVSDFEIDFQTKGTPSKIIHIFSKNIDDAINTMARPIDAIKHQAKTVTVGTSRLKEKFEGCIFDEIAANKIKISQITNKNVIVLKNIQEIISHIKGGFLYRISELSLLGEVTPETKIELINKTGLLKNRESRVEKDPRLKGTKNIIVREGNVYIGKGKKDNKSILVIPVISSSPLTPNIIEYILSLNVAFKASKEVSLLKKIKALGGKHTRIKDLVLERENIQWDEKFLDFVEIEKLFGDSAEKISEFISTKIEILYSKK